MEDDALKTLIICVDRDGGCALFGKRQSSDCTLYARLARMAAGRPIHARPYSRQLFRGIDGIVLDITDDLDSVKDGFVFRDGEGDDPSRYDRIIVAGWNRRYPSDVRFSVDEKLFRLESSEEFAGNSHERLVLKTFSRRKEEKR